MEPSDMFNPTGIPDPLLTSNEESSTEDSGSPPDMLAKDLHKFTINPVQPVAQVRKERVAQKKTTEDFPKLRGVRTLSSVLKDPKAKMRRMRRTEKKLKSAALKGDLGAKSEQFRCTRTFCTYLDWDPSENARLGKN